MPAELNGFRVRLVEKVGGNTLAASMNETKYQPDSALGLRSTNDVAAQRGPCPVKGGHPIVLAPINLIKSWVLQKPLRGAIFSKQTTLYRSVPY